MVKKERGGSKMATLRSMEEEERGDAKTEEDGEETDSLFGNNKESHQELSHDDVDEVRNDLEATFLSPPSSSSSYSSSSSSTAPSPPSLLHVLFLCLYLQVMVAMGYHSLLVLLNVLCLVLMHQFFSFLYEPTKAMEDGLLLCCLLFAITLSGNAFLEHSKRVSNEGQ
jgi:hypothetical protein